jgi:hypothetical protein
MTVRPISEQEEIMRRKAPNTILCFIPVNPLVVLGLSQKPSSEFNKERG